MTFQHPLATCLDERTMRGRYPGRRADILALPLGLYTPAMFEYHGWITLRSTAEAVDDEPPLRLTEIQALVNELDGYALVDLRPMNGGYYIHLAGCANHRGAHGPALIALLVNVGQLAP